METLTDHFTEIVALQKQMGYTFPTLLRPAATLSEISAIEKRIEVSFNPELMELYRFADGTIVHPELPLGKIGLIPIYRLMSLSDAADCYWMYKNHLGFDLFEEWENGYKPGEKLFPILADSGGDYYWVDLNDGTENYSKIYWTNTYPSSPGYTFLSLSSMFRTICEAYKDRIFFLDAEGYLDEDYDRWYELARANNPGLTFWIQQD